jgi:hypothetical protein
MGNPHQDEAEDVFSSAGRVSAPSRQISSNQLYSFNGSNVPSPLFPSGDREHCVQKQDSRATPEFWRRL